MPGILTLEKARDKCNFGARDDLLLSFVARIGFKEQRFFALMQFVSCIHIFLLSLFLLALFLLQNLHVS